MKRPITPSYTFTPGSSTLNLSGIAGFDVRNLFAVIDLKTGALIYAPLAGYGYSALSGTTLTLQAAMAGLGAADPLMIIYDDGGKPSEDGLDATGVAAPAGGSGIRGWLSGIYKAIAGGAPNAPRAAAAGTLAVANDAVTVVCDGMNTAVVQLLTTSAWTAGAVAFEASMDGGVSYFAVNLVPYGGAAAVGTVSNGAAGTPQVFEMACGGLTHLRARATGAITGVPVAAIVAASNGLKSVRVGAPASNPVPVSIGRTASSGDTPIVVGGTAQALFAGATPANGWKVANPDVAEDLWVSDTTTAAPNGQGSYRIPAGGIVTTEPGEKPGGPVSIYGATTGHIVTARSW